MITKELIDSDLGFVLSELGKPVVNAAKWEEELGANAPSEAEILTKWDEIKAERAAYKSDEQIYNAELSKGFNTGLGFTISISEAAFKTVSVFIDWVKGVYADGEEATYLPQGPFLIDQENVPHLVTLDQLLKLKNAYGAACLAAYQLQPKK